ncbi:PSP1 domain-containing protein [Hippea maritima]|uniref:PSP1 domain protein n=1 Tax=Hippea maritima (strain ATCC 700847 / DSM 10411 / MH2) TaxID=760142 RepID=F2LWP7_HIPMA|nr:regulatory iron-sulfur-containing complex subunit RicT [Hippea maritima]AEA33025.1 PSP1 domain protein [Hippea maritima DSM 10411]
MKIAIVEFMRVGQLYPYTFDGELNIGDMVVAEYERGLGMGKVVKVYETDSLDEDIRSIVRKATEEDFKIYQENKEIEKEAFRVCRKEIEDLQLHMKLVKVDCMMDRKKIVFYFTSPTRVDFRTLVKRLASVFKTRIEMRQIGVRDEARIIGGLGLCGDELCCSRFLRTFNPVSMKMTKEQNLNINVKKISGACGRLMCCLWYEHETYEEFLKTAPPMDSIGRAGDVEGRVVYINPIKKTVILRTQDGLMVEVSVSDVEMLAPPREDSLKEHKEGVE